MLLEQTNNGQGYFKDAKIFLRNPGQGHFPGGRETRAAGREQRSEQLFHARLAKVQGRKGA
ncbi:hypothetical protein DXN05_02440 [Deminuibacter soli]|uniref:Uncharacterized protein n=1 Tax=Deminuibacter soli TaxID=2291815 RepID=A0A3E1NPL1_9BACT|nr:hypothetical protein DXN05_02440 [Deminuibacter soli]